MAKMSTIKKLIKQALSEVRIVPKPKFKWGVEHNIYQSKQNPNRLFKVGNEGVLDWAQIFHLNPEIFAKVYKVGKTTDSKYYAEIEKLDTGRAENEWQKIEDKLEELGITDYEDGSYGRDITDIYMNHGRDQKIITEITSQLKKYDSETYKLFVKYFKLFKDCEKAIEKKTGQETMLDVHRYNFGYSTDGKLKCLDI